MVLMKKINNNQVSCLVSMDELTKNNIKINDLLSGNENTADFIDSIIQSAIYEHDLNLNDKELFISICDVNEKYLSLLLTSIDEEEFDDYDLDNEEEIAGEDFTEHVIDLLNNYKEDIKEECIEKTAKKINIMGLFKFKSVDNICCLAHKIIESARLIKLNSVLYKDPKSDEYILCLTAPFDNNRNTFSDICQLCTEYKGRAMIFNKDYNEGTIKYLNERSNLILYKALEKLAL